MALGFLEIVRAIDYIGSLSPADVAHGSHTVRNAMDYIEGAVSALRDKSLTDACRLALERPEPAFLAHPGAPEGAALPATGTAGAGVSDSDPATDPAAARLDHGTRGLSIPRGTLRRSGDEIVEELVAEGFVPPGCRPGDIFPELPGFAAPSDWEIAPVAPAGPSGPMRCHGARLSFETAAGSTAGQHHAFPGGLAMHVASNLRRCLSLAKDYRDAYGAAADEDILVAACVLHDCMKPYVLSWSSDMEPRREGVIAGEGSHHVLSLAQALALGVEPAVVVAAASAPRDPGSARDEIAAFVAAACVVAGIEVEASGAVTREDGARYALITPDRLEQWLVHFSDSDHILTNHTARVVDKELAALAVERYGFSREDLRCARYRKVRNYILARLPSERLYWKLSSSGRQALAEEVGAVLEEAASEARGRGGPDAAN